MELVLLFKLDICHLFFGLEIKDFELTRSGHHKEVPLLAVSLQLCQHSINLELRLFSLLLHVILHYNSIFDTHVEVSTIRRAIDALPWDFVIAEAFDFALKIPQLKSSLVMLKTLWSITNHHELHVWRDDCCIYFFGFLQGKVDAVG